MHGKITAWWQPVSTGVVDLLDESRHQALLANPGLLALELRDVPRDRVVVLDEVQRVPALRNV